MNGKFMGITFLDVPVILYSRKRIQANEYISDCWRCNESLKKKNKNKEEKKKSEANSAKTKRVRIDNRFPIIRCDKHDL